MNINKTLYAETSRLKTDLLNIKCQLSQCIDEISKTINKMKIMEAINKLNMNKILPHVPVFFYDIDTDLIYNDLSDEGTLLKYIMDNHFNMTIKDWQVILFQIIYTLYIFNKKLDGLCDNAYFIYGNAYPDKLKIQKSQTSIPKNSKYCYNVYDHRFIDKPICYYVVHFCI